MADDRVLVHVTKQDRYEKLGGHIENLLQSEGDLNTCQLVSKLRDLFKSKNIQNCISSSTVPYIVKHYTSRVNSYYKNDVKVYSYQA